MEGRRFIMSEKKQVILSMFILVSVIIAGWIAVSWQEARSVNRITGTSNLTTWDAMFVKPVIHYQEEVHANEQTSKSSE